MLKLAHYYLNPNQTDIHCQFIISMACSSKVNISGERKPTAIGVIEMCMNILQGIQTQVFLDVY